MTSYQTYLDRVNNSLPETVKDKIDGWDEDFEFAYEFDVLTEEGSSRANAWIMELQSGLSSMEGLNGAQKTAVSRTLTILVENGWDYHTLHGNTEVSTEKGADGISYTTVEYSELGRGIAMLKEGRGSKIRWDISELPVSNNLPLYVASVPAWQIDLTSNVPALEKTISHNETSRRITDSTRAQGNWQRAINIDNRQAIAEFFDRDNTFFANPVILHLKNDTFVQKSENILEIDLSFFQQNGSSFDGDKDQRPFVIIDGQHRVRGAANSIHNSSNTIPVIILSSDIAEHTGGRIFSEINTLSAPLKEFHRIFLAHRFAVKSPEQKYTFGIAGPNDNEAAFQRDRANRLSYETAAKLVRNSELWERKIKILDQNTSRGQVLGISKWLEFSYNWFSDYPYTIHNNLNSDQMYDEISAYFKSWIDLLGAYWDVVGIDKCLFKSKTQARVMLRRFPQVYELAKAKYPDIEVLEESHFSDILQPLKNIPFTNEELLERYLTSFTPEVNWQLLDAWVQDAISHQVCYEADDIMNLERRGLAGRGILSMPAEQFEYTLPPRGTDPSDGETRYLNVTRPKNASHSCKIEFWHAGEEVVSAGASWTSRVIVNSENIPIRNRGAVIDYQEDLIMRIRWQTIAGWSHFDVTIKK